ncbi:MAG: hypothetical protein J6Z02_07170 [Lachnospiraceae bacterium]|nr:hypothetical protein [Lachnospiraceae bacterium]
MKRIRAAIALCLLLSLTVCTLGCGGSENTASSGNDSIKEEAVKEEAVKEKAVKQDPPVSEIFKQVFEKITDPSSLYSERKNLDTTTNYTETLDGDKMTFVAEGTYLNGTYEFVTDGAYIVSAEGYNDYLPIMLFSYIAQAVGEIYGQDKDLINGLLKAISNSGIKSDSANMEIVDDKIVYKVKMTEPLDLTPLDSVYIDDSMADYFEPLTEDYTSSFVGTGKINALVNGNKDRLTIDIAEHGGRTDLTYKSIITIVENLQPTGYEDFLTRFTELMEIDEELLSVKFVDDKYEMSEFFQDADDHNVFVAVRFGEPESEDGYYYEEDYEGDDFFEDEEYSDDEYFDDEDGQLNENE